MPVVIVVGVQWGDEGKGKVVDYLTEDADLVVRFQGGDNAGHTVVVEGKKTALRLIPSGILRPTSRCLLASGVVVNPRSLLDEFASLSEAGIEVTPERFGIAGEVQLIMPYHREVDRAREESRVSGKIGTTGKGIGPAYEDAVSRSGIRLIDLFNPKRLESLVRTNCAAKAKYLQQVLGVAPEFEADSMLQSLKEMGEVLKPYLANVSLEVWKAEREGKFVVFEGAQGCLLDINHGTYPFVTSSSTVSGFACASAGIGPRSISKVIGICKAYCTRVGSGPFPTEDSGADGETLRRVGVEFGTVTGRPRRCGWFDSVAVRKAIRLNGIESIVLTKLDVLSGFDTVKIATQYTADGRVIDELPACADEVEGFVPVYEELPGWTEDIGKVRRFEDLPLTAQKFIRRIEVLTECSIGGFSVGPGREQTIVLDERLYCSSKASATKN